MRQTHSRGVEHTKEHDDIPVDKKSPCNEITQPLSQQQTDDFPNVTNEMVVKQFQLTNKQDITLVDDKSPNSELNVSCTQQQTDDFPNVSNDMTVKQFHQTKKHDITINDDKSLNNELNVLTTQQQTDDFPNVSNDMVVKQFHQTKKQNIPLVDNKSLNNELNVLTAQQQTNDFPKLDNETAVRQTQPKKKQYIVLVDEKSLSNEITPPSNSIPKSNNEVVIQQLQKKVSDDPEKVVRLNAVRECLNVLGSNAPVITSVDELMKCIENCESEDALIFAIGRKCNACFTRATIYSLVTMICCNCTLCHDCLRTGYKLAVKESGTKLNAFSCVLCRKPDNAASDSIHVEFLLNLSREIMPDISLAIENRLLQGYLESDGEFMWCSGCKNGFMAVDISQERPVKCNVCSKQTCVTCKLPWTEKHQCGLAGQISSAVDVFSSNVVTSTCSVASEYISENISDSESCNDDTNREFSNIMLENPSKNTNDSDQCRLDCPHENLARRASEDTSNSNEIQKLGKQATDKIDPNMNMLQCPHCKIPIEKSGGCLHMTCSKCHLEFCASCNEKYYRDSCPKCTRLTHSTVNMFAGLHAHHPRNCLYYLRDFSLDALTRFVKVSISLPYDMSALVAAFVQVYGNRRLLLANKQYPKHFCHILEQKHQTSSSEPDTVCGREVTRGFATNICDEHYKEFLAKLIRKHHVDPVHMHDDGGLRRIIARESLTCVCSERNSLIEFIKNKLPL